MNDSNGIVREHDKQTNGIVREHLTKNDSISLSHRIVTSDTKCLFLNPAGTHGIYTNKQTNKQ